MREPDFRSGFPASIRLIIVIAAVYALQLVGELAAQGGRTGLLSVLNLMALQPAGHPLSWLFQLLTFQFLHAGPLHLILNCAMLYMFGRAVEDILGKRKFLALYFASGVAGGVVQLLLSMIFPGHFGRGPVIGASAGVYGLIAAFAVFHWEDQITTLVAFILPVTMRAKYLLLVLAVLGVFGLLESRSGIAHGAHLGGMVFALFASKRLANEFFSWPSLPRLRPRPRVVRTVAAGSRAESPGRPVETAPAETLSPDFISREVDPILEKISAHGIQSLTERERRILEAARSRISRR